MCKPQIQRPSAVARSVACPLRMQADPRSTFASGTVFVENDFPLTLTCPLMAEELAPNTGKLPPEQYMV